jgi:hypothetical protein
MAGTDGALGVNDEEHPEGKPMEDGARTRERRRGNAGDQISTPHSPTPSLCLYASLRVCWGLVLSG